MLNSIDGEQGRVFESAKEKFEKHNAKVIQEIEELRREGVPLSRCACPVCSRPGAKQGRGYLLSRVQMFRADGQPLLQVNMFQVCAGCNGYGFLI